ncbi:class I SAM-dependent methyltransferase [Candidatus Electronema sp. TJ]|uniref:class I SAM-dependent methyltransferase n=1 Tax=Candidatus Electronema sp. TJ TaxID=3401573 RepID=UPI003AA9BE66
MRKITELAAVFPPDLAVACAAPELRPQTEALAARLGLPVAAENERRQLLLRCTAEGLELVKPDDPQLRGPLRVDFVAGAFAFRCQQQGKELLLRAAGCKGGFRPAVLDATGGLGRDSFLLAAAGCAVHIFERNPVVAALLADGLERARLHPAAAAIASRISLSCGCSVAALRAAALQGERIELVYLDPMFPERSKTALVKKEAQLLQLLSPPPSLEEEKALLDAARAASHRVAVKRPAKSPHLAGQAPSHALHGKTVRFDVYLAEQEPQPLPQE